jgi:hypothetical protein
MTATMTYRGREIHPADITCIRTIIGDHPAAKRQELSRRVCEAWNWTQPNGQPKHMVCRGLLLRLHEQGLIQLPPPRSRHAPQARHAQRPKPVEVDDSPITGALRDIQPLRFMQVRRTPLEQTFNGLVEMFHYLGYRQPVGEHLKYLVFAHGRPVACLAFASATCKLAARDAFIGWSDQARNKNLHLLAYNTRFLILPWVRIAHLASHLLGLAGGTLARDWTAIYHHPVLWLETMVDTSRFAGTSYRAANWILLGKSSGRGLRAKTGDPRKTIKDVYGHPLSPDFRERLCHG